MLDHVIEFVRFLRMALFHGCNNVHHPSAGVSGSQVSARAEEYELRDVSVIEAYAAAVRSAVFPDLEPNNIRLVLEPPSLHGFQPPCKESIRAPRVEVGLFRSNLGDWQGSTRHLDVVSFANVKRGIGRNPRE